jgi:hypothetical protein
MKEETMNCVNHESALATSVCASCGRALCPDCTIRWQGKVSCKTCLESKEFERVARVPMQKSPTVAALLSLMPGLGQVYVGYYLAGFINIIVVALILNVVTHMHGPGPQAFLGLFLAFFWLFNILDAGRRANLYNRHLVGTREEALPTDSPLVGGIILLIIGLLLTLAITLHVQLHFLETIWPLGLVAAALYLLAKYWRTRAAMMRRGSENEGSTGRELHG